MITIYIQKSNASSKKLVRWLEKEKIEYKKRYIDKKPLTESELLSILSLTENGFEDIFSYRSMEHSDFNIEYINSLSVKELVRLMIGNPKLIKKPFAIKGRTLVVGYGMEQVKTLIPKKRRSKDYLHYQLELLSLAKA